MIEMQEPRQVNGPGTGGVAKVRSRVRHGTRGQIRHRRSQGAGTVRRSSARADSLILDGANPLSNARDQTRPDRQDTRLKRRGSYLQRINRVTPRAPHLSQAFYQSYHTADPYRENPTSTALRGDLGALVLDSASCWPRLSHRWIQSASTRIVTRKNRLGRGCHEVMISVLRIRSEYLVGSGASSRTRQ